MSVYTVEQSLIQVGIPTDKAIIIGSGILDKLGIRKAADIDVVVPKDEFNKLADNDNFIKAQKFGGDYYKAVASDMEVWYYWWDLKKDIAISYDDLAENSVVIDGLRFVSLPFLRQWKVDYGRAKDIEDIKLIDEFMEANRER